MLFSLQDTKKVLQTNTVTDQNRIISFLVVVLLFALGVMSNSALNIGANILVLCVGTYYALHKNTSGDGKNFLERYIVLSSAVQIRVILALILMSISIGILDVIIHFFLPAVQLTNSLKILNDYAPWTDMISTLILGMITYYVIGKVLAEVAGVNSDSKTRE